MSTMDTVEELELRRAERWADTRMRSAEHWLCLQADAWLERPTESTAAEMRKARDEWRSREAVWRAAHDAAYGAHRAGPAAGGSG